MMPLPKILLFKYSGDDLIPPDSGSSESETKWLCEKCSPLSRDVLHEISHRYNCQSLPHFNFHSNICISLGDNDMYT